MSHMRGSKNIGFVAVCAASVIVAAAIMAPHVIDDAYAEPVFHAKFGEQGDSNGEFNAPMDVALYKNYIYVVDSQNNRVQKLQSVLDDDKCFGLKVSDGFCFVEKYGSRGSGNGQFDGPVSITREDRDMFFVLDANNTRVHTVDDTSIKSNFEPSQLKKPVAVATHEHFELVYVADHNGDAIRVFEDTGNFKYDIKKFKGNITMSDPSGIVIDTKSDYMYVADSGKDRILAFLLVDERMPVCPVGMAEVEKGVCFDRAFGTKGSGDAQFENPTGLAIYPSSSDAVGKQRGSLYVADTGNNRVQIFQFTHNDASCPAGTTNVTEGVCYVDKFGKTGSKDGEFKMPHGMAVDSKNNILYVADTGNDRVQAIKIDAPSGTGSSSSSNSSSGSSSTTTTTISSSKPAAPTDTSVVPISPSSLLVKWKEPDSAMSIAGYKVEYRSKSSSDSSFGDFELVTAKTPTNATSLLHTGLDPDVQYGYRVSAVVTDDTGADIVGNVGSVKSARPADTNRPTIVDAVALTKSAIKLTWLPPSNTFKQSIGGFVIYQDKNKILTELGDVGSSVYTFHYNIPDEDRGAPIQFRVKANFGIGSTPNSDPVSVTVRLQSDHSGIIEPNIVQIVNLGPPTAPIKVAAKAASESAIEVTWSAPTDTGNLDITGYRIESKTGDSADFATLGDDITSTRYLHDGVDPGSSHTYRVYATNSKGTSDASNESTATARAVGISIGTIGSQTAVEGETVSFLVRVSGDTAGSITYKLNEAPTGAAISQDGRFTWTPSAGQGGESYTFEIEAKSGDHTDGETVRIRVNEPAVQDAPPTPLPETPTPDPVTPATIVELGEDPQSYVDRYETDPSYKEWFDTHHLEQYGSIYAAVGLPPVPAGFVEEGVDPQSYVDRYNAEESYKQWFDDNHPQYDSIYHAVGLDDPSMIQDEPERGDEPDAVSMPATDTEPDTMPDPAPDASESEPVRELPRLDVSLAPFVDETEDPMTYVERYNTDATYKQWFDDNYSAEYGTIYRAVGLLDVPAEFVDPSEDPASYVERYNTDATYKQWFDENYSEYLSIYHAVGLPEPEAEKTEEKPIQYGICGPGTELVEGVCTIVVQKDA